jgi:predicted AlkP superfamily pyrophosphatase or phosphodiesterase
MRHGTYANYMKSVFPAYTHPAHAAMETGALPARSGIIFNQPKSSKGEWNWYYDSIKAPTIWGAIKKAGMTTAAIMWPNTVDGDITYNVSEIWDKDHPGDRATIVREHTRPRGLYEDIEQNATGKLDSTNMNDSYFSLDENAGRMAANVFRTYKPNFLALHFACVDGEEHEFGRDGDSVRLALEANDRAIGEVLQAIVQSGLRDSTTVLIVGDHGFCTIHTVLRPNMLISDMPVKFIAAGGSAFLYSQQDSGFNLVQKAIARLDALPPGERKLFRIVDRKELDRMGADSSALLALSAVPGTVFSGSIAKSNPISYGPGTVIRQSDQNGFMAATSGGHHGYDPDLPDMWTGFIATGAGIRKGKMIDKLCVTDIAPLVMRLLGIEFKAPDGVLPGGVLQLPN